MCIATPGPCDHEDHDMTKDMEPNEARQGRKTGVVRYVLGISTVLAVIAMAAIWFAWA
jgi:hypothetical protein